MKMKKPLGREKPKNKLTLGIIHNEESHLTDAQISKGHSAMHMFWIQMLFASFGES